MINIEEIRGGMPALSQMLQVNSGTKGICAGPVVDALVENTRRIEAGGFTAYCDLMREAASARDRLAAFFHCEIASSRSRAMPLSA